jgi:hypothetical protein
MKKSDKKQTKEKFLQLIFSKYSNNFEESLVFQCSLV